MQWLNFPGIMVMAALMAPNILYAKKHAGAQVGRVRGAGLMVALEQIGRYGCVALLCIRLPLWQAGFASAAAQTVWLSLSMVLLAAYFLVWVFYFHRTGKVLAMLLAAIPSALFLLCGFLWRSLPLAVLATVFTVAHLRVTWVSLGQAEE